MANPITAFRRRLRSGDWNIRNIRKDSDAPLNYRPDQVRNIKRKLRELNLERGIEVVKASASVMLLGTALGLLVMRKYKLGSFFVLGFLLQKALSKRRDPKEIELQRYALKVERGDFGKLEVIPFR